MPVSPVTNQFMRALPAALRPNPWNIDEYVMRAVENGWHTDDLAKACYVNEKNPNPSFVVTNVRSLCEHPPAVQRLRSGWDYGHLPCEEQYHPVGCQICRCIPGEQTHMVPVPATDPALEAVIGRKQ
jgi:hypothetical protein